MECSVLEAAPVTVPVCIAELGGNHSGDMHTARRMVEIVANYCTEHFQLTGDKPRPYVKFQKRTCTLELYPDWLKPHPNPAHAYGGTYLEHRRALEFDIAQHHELKTYAGLQGAGYSCSVWDIPAAKQVITLEPEWVKVPSACNQDYDMLAYLIDNYAGDIHISLGMTTRNEVARLYDFLTLSGSAHRTVFYACTSNYPVEPESVCLRELDWIQRAYPALKAVGFSGHHHGIAVDMAAVAMGAKYIERHFTLNRTWKGTDHSASLEPDGFRKLLRDVGNVEKGMGSKPVGGLLACEEGQREKLKREMAA